MIYFILSLVSSLEAAELDLTIGALFTCSGAAESRLERRTGALGCGAHAQRALELPAADGAESIGESQSQAESRQVLEDLDCSSMRRSRTKSGKVSIGQASDHIEANAPQSEGKLRGSRAYRKGRGSVRATSRARRHSQSLSPSLSLLAFDGAPSRIYMDANRVHPALIQFSQILFHRMTRAHSEF